MPSPRQSTYEDVNLLLRLYDLRREDRMRKARAWFVMNFRPATLEELQKLCPVGSEENASFRMVTSYWEMVASFVKHGVLNEDLFFDNTREMLIAYIRMKAVLPALREANKDPFVMHNLEAVARSFAEWLNRRAPGSYEAFEGRLK